MTFDRPAPADPRRRQFLTGGAVALPFAPARAARPAFEFARHSGWAAVNEPPVTPGSRPRASWRRRCPSSARRRRTPAARVQAPLEANLADSCMPRKIGTLGSRSRTALMAHGGSAHRQPLQLKGRRVALPGPLAGRYRLLRQTSAKSKGMLGAPMPFGWPAADSVHAVRTVLREGGP